MGFVEYVIAYQELLGFVAAGLSAISFLPQLIKIWRFRSVKDISTGMYVIYAVSVILWSQSVYFNLSAWFHCKM